MLRLLSRQIIDQTSYEDQYQFIDKEFKTLVVRQSELESMLSKEKDTETSPNAFQKEIQRFTQLELDDEEKLRQVLHKLLDRVEVHEDGSLTIHYNFKKPILMGA